MADPGDAERSRGWRVLVSVGVALAVLAACTQRGGKADRARTPPPASSPSGAPFEPGAIVDDPCGLAPTATDVWVLACSGRLVRVPKDGGPARAQTLEGEVVALDAILGGGSEPLRVLLLKRGAGARAGLVVEVDGASGRTKVFARLGSSIPIDAVLVRDRLWLVTLDGRLLAARTGELSDVSPRGPPFSLIAADGAHVWSLTETGDVAQRDAASGALQRTFEGLAPGAIAAAAAFGSLWVAPPGGGLVAVDGRSGRTRRMDLPGSVNDIERCGDGLWVSQQDLGDGRVGLRALSATGAILRTLPLEMGPRYLHCDGTMLWILSEDGHLGSISASA